MKTTLIVILCLLIDNAYALRCNNVIISTGENVATAYEHCGSPDVTSQNEIIYTNPDHDGMNYAVMYDGNGMITGIQFSKGDFDASLR